MAGIRLETNGVVWGRYCPVLGWMVGVFRWCSKQETSSTIISWSCKGSILMLFRSRNMSLLTSISSLHRYHLIHVPSKLQEYPSWWLLLGWLFLYTRILEYYVIYILDGKNVPNWGTHVLIPQLLQYGSEVNRILFCWKTLRPMALNMALTSWGEATATGMWSA
jgi:hypothetical protein